MSNITKEKIDKYAHDLLIGLTDEETTMIQSEFDTIEKNMNLINEIPNIKEVEPLSYPFEMVIDELRDDNVEGERIEVEDLLSNCERIDGREVEVPKVVS